MSKISVNLDHIDAIINKHQGDKGHWYFLQELEEFENMPTQIVWDMDEQIMEHHEEEMSREDLNKAILGRGEV